MTTSKISELKEILIKALFEKVQDGKSLFEIDAISEQDLFYGYGIKIDAEPLWFDTEKGSYDKAF